MRRVVLALLIGLVLLVAVSLWRGGEPTVASGSTLVLVLAGDYSETPETPLASRLLGRAERPFVSLLSELRKAERDGRIAAVVVRVRNLEIGWGQAQELRDAIDSLDAAGKRTLAFLELEAFGANLEYYVASAASEVHAAPGATAPVVGLAAEYLFLGGLWEKLGIGIEVERVGDYKTAADFLAGREMSEAHREMAEALLGSIDAQFVAGIAEARGIPESEVRRAIDIAPVRASELLGLGLIDGIGHFEGVVEDLGAPAIQGTDYAGVDPASVGFAPVARFALVYGSGAVVLGEGGSSPGGGPVFASDAVVEALGQAAGDDAIDAIVLRVDSPGGSPLASDAVWRATQRARQSGKPFVVSMGDVAASGGYYVACGADRIFADPGTFTGSIGVFVLRPVLGDLYAKLDVGVEALTRGAHADLLLASRGLSDASRARLRDEVRSIYALFVERVAAGRGLEPEEVDAVGRGRVWTGAQAAERGLVDSLGGLRAAVAHARKELQLAEDADVELVPFPRPKSLAEQLGEALGGVALRALGDHPALALARRLEPWWQAASAGGPVLLPPLSIEIR